MRQMEAAAELLAIAHHEPRLQILYGDDRERLLFTDGRKDQADLDRGVVEIRTSWKSGGKLRVRSETAYGAKIRETWELAAEGRQLVVTTRIDGDGPMPAIEFTRVYDRQTEAGPATIQP